ncbi:MAG: hypothetical protein L6Q92_08455 [Phycisphaerae bacterium]|nr:hypothetical protein [Phycisphaerae bacterium]
MSASESSVQPVHESRRESRARVVFCFLLTLAGLQVALGPKVRLSQWELSGEKNAGVAEGAAWLDGRLDLPFSGGDPRHDRPHDTALFDGKVYNVFPPLVSMLTAALGPLHRALLGRADVWVPWTYVAIAFWPLPIVAYAVFRRQVGDAAWAGLLVASYLGGTAVLPNLCFARFGHLGQVNHVLSQVGLLIFAADVLGRRRLWPGLIGLAIAAWSRQMTLLYVLPLLWIARQRGRFALAVIGLTVIAAPMLTLNQLKFGSPIDFGYRYIYEGRAADEPMAERCLRYGTFSPRFAGENAYYLFAALPSAEWSLTQLLVRPGTMGTSLLVTTPLVVMVLLGAAEWWRDARRRLLMLATLPVLAGLLCYHSPGFMQVGYNRFALDFLPVWLVVIAPQLRGGWRTGLTLGCTAWSLLYFQAVVPNI